jgi:UDP-glucuronate 4-epimerase
MKVLLTGAAGFIGMHVAERLLARGDQVVGVDNLNPYYDVALKRARLSRLTAVSGFSFAQTDIADREAMAALFREHRPDGVVNLAAQAGVRYSLVNPHAYVDSNLQGFVNVLEGCRHNGVKHLVYASTSSVYGSNTQLPFGEGQGVDHPISLYAATKKANELMAHSYSHLFNLPTTGLRFFTVYGPWGRPDMALFLFTKAMLAGEPVTVFNHGQMVRDFTYVDDIAEGVVRVLDRPAEPDPAYSRAQPHPATSHAPYRVFNIGNSQPVPLMDYIAAIEKALGRKATLHLKPMPKADVQATMADTTALEQWVEFKPRTTVAEGVAHFVAWYAHFYGCQLTSAEVE